MTIIYFGGGEDSENYAQGSGSAISTTANTFRSTYARCSMACTQNGSWLNWEAYAGTPSSFWFSARTAASTILTNGNTLLRFVDASRYARLQLIISGGVLLVQKVNTAGTATTLANALAPWAPGFAGPAQTDKIDIHWVNSASGSVDIWFNGVKYYNYSGDTTTETTAISFHQLTTCQNAQTSYWSEVIVADQDTRTWNLQTLAPVANGNTHNFDTGTPAAANVNEVTLSYATLDGSTTAGQKDQYTIPAIAAGTYTIVAVGVSSQLVKGTSGPSKMDLGVRSGTTDYWSSDQTLDVGWNDYQNWWTTDPDTSAVWVALPVNIGLKSVT